ISAHHTWFGRSTATPRKRYGNILCPGAGLVVRGFGPSAAIPILWWVRVFPNRSNNKPANQSKRVEPDFPRARFRRKKLQKKKNTASSYDPNRCSQVTGAPFVGLLNIKAEQRSQKNA